MTHLPSLGMPAKPNIGPRRLCLWAFSLALWASAAFAGNEPDWLPEVETETAKALAASPTGRVFVELAGDYMEQSDSARDRWHGNIGIDGYVTRALDAKWRALLSGRFDVDSESGMGLSTRNLSVTLREAYLSRDAGDWTFDIGRINVRDGVAVGYTPTDVFRAGSLPVRRTFDPARLRESRLGVVGLRAQAHTSAGTFAGLLAPPLHVPADPSWYDPLWGAVNDGQAQLYLRYTPPRWRGLYANALGWWGEDGNHAFGLNAVNNFGQSVVGYAEYAYTRQPTLSALALDPGAAPRGFSQASAGVSITNSMRQTFTFEYNRNGGGVRPEDLQRAQPQQVRAVFDEALRRQDPLGRDSLMFMLQWDRFLAHDADLTCLARFNVSDDSRFGWCEWRYKQPKAEWSFYVSRFSGDGTSEFGALRQPWAVGAKVRFYF